MLFSQFFKGQFLCQDTQTGDLYYGWPSDSPDNRIKVLLPLKQKHRAQDKRRAPNERKSLSSRLVAWRYDAHTKDPLAAVTPPSFILDDASIMILARFHPQNLTSHQQITIILDKTLEWEKDWSEQIFNVIQQFDQDLMALRQTTAAQTKTQQKRLKVAQDAMSFAETTKNDEERIRLQVLQKFTIQQSSSANVRTLETSTISNLP